MSDDAAIREHMNEILLSPGFQNSQRLCRFLKFTVEAKLRGEQDQIKEYILGREVFDRDEQYDPRLDPIVRVEARRLRKKLDEFYAANPATLRIEFPKGAYSPEFVRQDPASPSPPMSPKPREFNRTKAVAILGVVLAGVIVAALLVRNTTPPGPKLAIIPARWIWQNQGFPAITYDEEIAELTAAELANRNRSNLVAWPLLQKYRRSEMRDIAAGLNLDRAVIVAVRVEAGGFRVTSYLMDPKRDRKLNVVDLQSQPLATLEDRRKVAQRLATELETLH